MWKQYCLFGMFSLHFNSFVSNIHQNKQKKSEYMNICIPFISVLLSILFTIDNLIIYFLKICIFVLYEMLLLHGDWSLDILS